MVPLWSRKQEAEMQSLSNEQKQELVQIINEEFGVGMTLEDFTEALLSLLEDVAGFETAS